MIESIPSNSLVLVVELQLRKLLDLLPPGWPEESTLVEIFSRGTRMRLTISPLAASSTDQELPSNLELSSCQRQVLEVTLNECERRGCRLQGSEIRVALKNAGHHWSNSSVNQALADLVANRLLSNHHDRRGYGPPDPVQLQPEINERK